jgi:hypothetical protein
MSYRVCDKCGKKKPLLGARPVPMVISFVRVVLSTICTAPFAGIPSSSIVVKLFHH